MSAVRRLLLVLTADVEPRALERCIGELRDGDAVEVQVVAPMAVSRLHWLTDDDTAERRQAEERAEHVAGGLSATSHAEAADPDPVQAVEDALATFPADEIVLVTHEEQDAGWLEEAAFQDRLEQFGRPVRHLAVRS